MDISHLPDYSHAMRRRLLRMEGLLKAFTLASLLACTFCMAQEDLIAIEFRDPQGNLSWKGITESEIEKHEGPIVVYRFQLDSDGNVSFLHRRKLDFSQSDRPVPLPLAESHSADPLPHAVSPLQTPTLELYPTLETDAFAEEDTRNRQKTRRQKRIVGGSVCAAFLLVATYVTVEGFPTWDSFTQFVKETDITRTPRQLPSAAHPPKEFPKAGVPPRVEGAPRQVPPRARRKVLFEE